MSKMTQGHIDCLVNWMISNPGKRLNVEGTWRHSGYSVVKGYGTVARKKVYQILQGQGYEIDEKQACLVSKRKRDKEDIDAKLSELEKIIEQEPLKPQPKDKPILEYETILTAENIQIIGKSLQGMVYTAQLKGQKAKVTISVEMGAYQG